MEKHLSKSYDKKHYISIPVPYRTTTLDGKQLILFTNEPVY